MGRYIKLKLFIGYVAFLVLSLVLIVRCNAQNPETYLEDFKRDAARFGKTLYSADPTFVLKDEALFITRRGKEVAVDAYVDFRPRIIYVDTGSNMWYRYPQVLVYHEFGHYYFTRGHNSTLGIDGMPVTLMGIYWYNDVALEWSLVPPIKQDYYLKELFNK